MLVHQTKVFTERKFVISNYKTIHKQSILAVTVDNNVGGASILLNDKISIGTENVKRRCNEDVIS